MDAEAEETGYVRLLRRLARILSRLAQKYANTAKKEAERDLQRILSGVMALLVAGVLSVHATAFAHVVAIVGLVQLGVPLIWVVLGVFSTDLFLILVALTVARSMILRPLLPETRASIRELQQAYDLIAG